MQDQPGSQEAVQRGCTCPAAENNFGRGRSKNGVIQPAFAADPECPIHGIDALLRMVEESGEPIHGADAMQRALEEWARKDRDECRD